MKPFDYLMNNPHRLPEVHVMLRNGVTSAKDGAIYCSGNCFECADVSAARVLGYSKERIKQIKNRLKEDL